MTRSKKDTLIIGIAILFFIGIIIYSKITNLHYYIIDSIIFIIISLLMYITYDKVKLNTTSLCFILFALILHDLGAFRFYATPPISIDWDIITHIIGILAATIFLYNLTFNLSKKHQVTILILVLLAANGVGVIIEFVEFFGFMTTGFGEGFLGRGFGDFDPQIVSSDYLDTIQDLFWNVIGSVLGFIIAYATYSKKAAVR